MFLEWECTNSAAQSQLTVILLVNNALLHQEGCSYSAHTEWQCCICYNFKHVQWTQKCRRNIFSCLQVQPVALGSIWCDAAPQFVFDWSAGCAWVQNTACTSARMSRRTNLAITDWGHAQKEKSLFWKRNGSVNNCY